MSNMITKKELRSTTSLPSRSHPSTSGVEQALDKIKAKNITTSSFESSLMGLVGLEELYDCMEEFLKMDSTQRVMSSDGSEFMEEMLDGSLRLMDICSVSRDLMLETNEYVRGVQTYVRRKKVAGGGGGGNQLDVAVSGYVRFRKNMRKEAKKLLGSLKNIDGDSCSSSLVNNGQGDEHLVTVIDVMTRVVSVSVSVLKSFLELLSARKSNMKRKLALVLKKKKSHYQEAKNEFESLDSAVLIDFASPDDDLQMKLDEVEMSVCEFEKSLGELFRRLIRTRASFLNIISH